MILLKKSIKKELNIFIEVFEKESIIRAKEIDKKIKENSPENLQDVL